MDSGRLPSTGGVGWRNSRRLFDGCRTPGRTTHGTSCWRSCSLLLRRHCVAPRAPRTWPRLGTPRKGCCGWSCSCSTGAQPRYLQPGLPPAGPAGVRGRIPPVPGRLRQSQRTGAARCGGGGRQSLARCLRAWPAKHPLHMVNVWAAEARMCLAQRKAPRPQRGSGGVGSPGPAGPRRLYRYRGCTALPSRLCHHGARAGCGLRAGAQGEPEQVVRCGRSELCAQRSPPRCRTARTRHSRSLRVAAPHRPARHQFRCGPEVPRRRCAGPHHLAQTRAWYPRGASPGTLLPALQIYSRQAVAAHRALPLGHREPAALGARCRLQRGSQPNSERQRARKPPILRKLALNLVRSHPAATSLRQKIERAGWTTPSSWACSVICDSPACEREGEDAEGGLLPTKGRAKCQGHAIVPILNKFRLGHARARLLVRLSREGKRPRMPAKLAQRNSRQHLQLEQLEFSVPRTPRGWLQRRETDRCGAAPLSLQR